MKLIIHETPEQIKALSNFTGKQFCAPSEKHIGGAVYIYVRGTGIELKQAIGFQCPVVVVAGNKDRAGKELIQQAQSLGVPDKCIVVKSGDTVQTCSGIDLGPAVRGGISVRQVLKVAERAHQNQLYPEMLIWSEQSESVAQNTRTEAKPEQPKRIVPDAAKQKPTGKTMLNIPFEEFINSVSLIVGIVLDGDGSLVFKEIANQLNLCHIRTSEKLSKEEVLASGNGYVSQKDVIVPAGAQRCLMEFSFSNMQLDMLDLAYRRAEKVIHLAGDNSLSGVKDWLGSGYKLDLIIGNEKTYQNLGVPVVTTSEQAVAILKGGD